MSVPTTALPQLLMKPRLMVFSTAVALAVIFARWHPVAGLGLSLSFAAILIAIWHGAFDGVVAEDALRPHFGAHWRTPFYVAYSALGAGMLLLWWEVPVVALAAFLLYSALHFGTESERTFTPERLIAGFAAGFVPIAASCHWWPREVTAIFAVMLRGSIESASIVTSVSGRSLWPIASVAVLCGLRAGRSERLTSWVLIASELVLFRSCTPVVAFALFFCLWHTPEHLLRTSSDGQGHFQLERLIHNLKVGFGFWLVSLAGVGVVCALGRHELYHYVGALFIALSALTVPHMALGELSRRQEAAPPTLPKRSLTLLRSALR